jgi:hypothetical protein
MDMFHHLRDYPGRTCYRVRCGTRQEVILMFFKYNFVY